MKKPVYYDAIKKLTDKYPSAGNLTIAKMAVRDNPTLFGDVEQARNRVRYYRGSSGAAHRRGVTSTLPTVELNPGKRTITGFIPYHITLPCHALVLSDVHIPYQDDEALASALDCGKREGVDTIILNGDAIDCHSISYFATAPSERNFKEELEQAKAFLALLRRKFPQAKIIYKLGNHEERYESYMLNKAPELLEVPYFAFENVYELDRLDIDLVDDRRKITIGDLNLLHGHEVMRGKSTPVNPARMLFLKAKTYAMMGHLHQASYHPGKDLNDRVVACWSTGCLCDLHPRYAPYNEWAHGFAIVTADKDGTFEVRTPVVKRGKVFA